jgi:hypothetical protein
MLLAIFGQIPEQASSKEINDSNLAFQAFSENIFPS